MIRIPFARPALTAFVALMPFALPASAAPVLTPHSQVQGERLAQPVACWWRNGTRHCGGARHYGYRYGSSYGYRPSYVYRGYGAPRPEDLRFGSTEWWRAMDREGRGGYRR